LHRSFPTRDITPRTRSDHPGYTHRATVPIDGRLAHIAELDDADQQALLDHLDALLTRTRLHAITNTGAT